MCMRAHTHTAVFVVNLAATPSEGSLCTDVERAADDILLQGNR